MSDRNIQCGTHGSVGGAFICVHLLNDQHAPLGFNEPEVDPGEEPQAWCDACDALVERDGEWNEENEKFADIKLVCEFCFARIKALHDHDLG